jgi:hypothetical protein
MSRALAALLVAALGTPVLAADIYEQGSFKLEASGFYKPALTLYAMQPSLVEATKSLQAAIDEARTLVPPEVGTALPASMTLPGSVGLSTHTLRLQARAAWTEKLDLEVAWQLGAVIASNPAFAGTGSSGFLGSPLVTAQRRLVDWKPFLLDEGAFKLQHNLDRLAVTWRTTQVTVVVGRQVISWGTGRLWNPTDLMSPFAPTDLDREVRRGVDAVRLSVGLGATSQVDLLWLPQPKAVDVGAVIRARTNLAGWDFSLTLAKYARDLVIGGDFSGDLGKLGAHGEAAWTLPLVGLDGSGPVRVEGDFGRAVVGVDWKPVDGLFLTAEYLFNGFGASRPEELLGVLTSERVVRGEIPGASRHAAGLVASYAATELLNVAATALVNLGDGSALFVPSAEYWFEQRVLVRAGGYVPVGRGLKTSVFHGLTGADVVGNTPRWTTASTTLGAQSEYGLAGYGVFLQVGLYVN